MKFLINYLLKKINLPKLFKDNGVMMSVDFIGNKSPQSVNNSLHIGGISSEKIPTKDDLGEIKNLINSINSGTTEEMMIQNYYVGTGATHSVNNSLHIGGIPAEELLTKKDLPISEGKTDVSETIYRLNATYINDFIKLDLKTYNCSKICDVKKLTVRTSYGDKDIDCKIVYEYNYALLYSKLLSKTSNWEFFTIEYNIIDNDKTYKPDLKGRIGRNFIQDEEYGGSFSYHSTRDRLVFESIYSQFGGTERKALESAVLKNGGILQNETDEYAVKYKFNLVARPYVGGAQSEEESSSPDILTIGSHYGNYYYQGGPHATFSGDPLKDVGARFDITSDANTFLKNTIAVSAGKNIDGTGNWTSYGFGVEFFEVYNRDEMNKMYPAKNLKTDRAICTISGRTITARSNYIHFTEYLEIGDKLSIQYWKTDYHNEDAIITKIIDNLTIEIDRYVTESNDVYLFATLTVGATYYGGLEQSATCSIVAAKFAIIQDRTDANWQLIREAARMTASNSTVIIKNDKKIYTTHWDMKRGFGIIDVDKATEYIFDNYRNNKDYIDSVIPYLPSINPMIKIDDLDNNNLITKKMLFDILKEHQKI